MTILYVNGDSHSAAAEAVNPHAFAEDDGQYFYMGRAPHPDNAHVSWGAQLASLAKMKLHLAAESASSNDRIIRTTKEWIQNHDTSNTLIIIQWSTWEREEWLINDTYYQVNASGIDIVPDTHKEQYKQYIANVNWNTKTILAHEKIWDFHEYLNDLNIKHVFFNGNSHFGKIASTKEWGNSYIDPYDQFGTFDSYLNKNGFLRVTPDSYHYGPDAHAAWAKHLLKYLIQNNLI